MTADQVLNILRVMGISADQVTIRRSGQMQICCPLAPWLHEKRSDSKPSLSIGFGKGTTLFKCFACGESGKIWQLVDSYGSLAKKPEVQAIALKIMDDDKPTLSMELVKACEGIEEWVKAGTVYKTPTIDKAAMRHWPSVCGLPSCEEYLLSRGIDRSMWVQFDLRYDTSKNRIVFPVYNRDNKLVGAVGRFLGKCPPEIVKYYNYFGFEASRSIGGENKWHEGRSRLIIVEGFFCLLKAYEWAEGMDADIGCTWHAEMSREQSERVVSLDRSTYICYDNDKAGNAGSVKALALLKGLVPVRRAVPPEGLDVGGMEKEMFTLLIDKASKELSYF